MSDSPAIPAATLIVMRERESRPPDLLMVERAQGMAFAGGALVFPGGRVDPGDRALALLHSEDEEDTAARIAAIRETLEEAGIAIGLSGGDAEAARALLHAGGTLGETGMSLDLSLLVPFARWLPHNVSHRVFDTRFYLAPLPPDAPDPVADGGESTRVFWASAREVLDEAAAGRATIIFPTRRNLERLALFNSYDDAVADARAHPVRTITPWIELRDGVKQLCIPNDAGYPVTAERLSSALRA